MMEIETANAMKKIERENLHRRAMDNPMDLELQRKIQEEIEKRNIEANMEMAMEFNPEVFARVHMLYIRCRKQLIRITLTQSISPYTFSW